MTVLLVSFPGDTEGCLCQELSGTEGSGKLRQAPGMALEASNIAFFRRGLSVNKTISSTHSDLRFFWGSSRLRAWGQVGDHGGDWCTQKKQQTCPGLPGTSHLIEEMG